MKLGVSASWGLIEATEKRRVRKGYFARLRNERVEEARRHCDSIPLAPWTPPVVIRVRARRGLP